MILITTIKIETNFFKHTAIVKIANEFLLSSKHIVLNFIYLIGW